jgi:hypothetical protein
MSAIEISALLVPVRGVRHWDRDRCVAVQYNDSVHPSRSEGLTLIETSGSAKIVGVVLSVGQSTRSGCTPDDGLERNERGMDHFGSWLVQRESE